MIKELAVVIFMVSLVLVVSGCTQIPEDIRYCEKAEDCVHVGCSCGCSGCGGFDYDDVVNKKYEDLWYMQENCSKTKTCLMVCCPPRYVDCENNTCVVKQGSPET